MSPVHHRSLVIPRRQPEDRAGLFRIRRPRSGHHAHNNRWQDTEVNHTHTAIHPPIKWEPQTIGLEGYGSSSSATSTPQRANPMEHQQQEDQPSFTLGITGIMLPEGMSEKDTSKDLILITKGWIPKRQFKLLEGRAARIRQKQATIQAIEEQLNQKEHTLIP
ncbi:hypothetical protein O181_064867 [Austropuccinia psidii MF-1]|uniref:Uncharacterized protein n=1 Tax=Austropuccinia psidii MF-1 TaxID=1389203 RepID=A0A9Q3EWH9_9BASI|nr:hypothetical protein [Austropuccinia psidii MF-1]